MSDDLQWSTARPDEGLEAVQERVAALERDPERVRLLDQLIAAHPDGFALIDADGMQLEVNEAFCRMTGFSREELVGTTPPFPFWPPEETAAIEEAFAASRRGETSTRELTFMRRDGERFPVEATPTVIRGPDGAMLLGVATFRDLSRLRHVEQALAVTQTDFRALVENVREVFVRYDLGFRFTYVSPVISTWLPLRPADMIGKSNLEAGFPPDLAELFDDALRRTLETLEPVALRFRIQGLAGEHVAESHVYPVRGADGSVAALTSISLDITERTRTEEALRESEAKYRSVVERASDAILIVDGERCLFANDVASRLSGYAADELPGLSLAAVIPAPAHGLLLHRARRRLAGEELPRTYVTELVHKDGSLFKAEISAGLITYGGAPANLLIVRDVTERERAAEALRRREVMHDTAEHVSRTGSFRWDLTNGEAVYSPEMHRLFDIDPEAFSGDFLEVIGSRVHPDDREELLRSVDRFRRSGTRGPHEFRVVRRDGATCILEGDAHLDAGESGGAPALVGYYRDVTQERAAAGVLRDTEELYRSLFEESPVPIFDLDASAPAGIRIVRVNQAAVELFGASGEDELLTHVDRRLPADLLAALPQILAEVASGVRVFKRRTSITRFDGEPRAVDIYGSVVPGHEKTLGRVLVSFIDVTDIARAETEIRRLNTALEARVASRTEQRDALNRELEAFAYSVAHDVRAPLRAIDGFSAVVMEDAADRLSEDDVAHLTRVRDAAQRMGELIDDLLGLSRMSRRELVPTRVDLSALAAEVGEDLRREAPERRVELTVAPGMTAWADPVLLRIVLHELLENAWKFTAGRDPAHVEVGRATDDASATPRFSVRDDGAGYDPRFAGHLFGAFQRVHPAAEFPGHGIGLATVQRLIARHGGSVWADGDPGGGATFWFSLPDQADAPPGAETTTLAAGPG